MWGGVRIVLSFRSRSAVYGLAPQSNALANKVSKEKQEDLKTFCSEFLALADVDTVRVTSIDRYAHPPPPRRPR